MKSVRTLSIVGIGFAVLYLGAAFTALFTYRRMLQTFAYYGVGDDVQLSIPEIAQTRSLLMSGFIQFFITGVVVAFLAFALFRGARWARHAWLWLITLLVFLHGIRLMLDIHLGWLFALERIVELLLVGTFAIFSWRLLTRPHIINALSGSGAT